MRSIFDLNFIFVRSDILISWRYVRSMFPLPNSSLAWYFFSPDILISWRYVRSMFPTPVCSGLLIKSAAIIENPFQHLPTTNQWFAITEQIFWWTLVGKVVENNHLILKSDQACQLQCWQLLIWLTQNKCPISGVSSLSTLGPGTKRRLSKKQKY